MVNRVLVGAHYGLKDWVIQRATAVIMALYTLLLFTVLGVLKPDSYAEWRAVFANGFVKFASFIFFVSLFYHAWIGVRDIWMDYIKPDSLRLFLMIATAAALVGYAAWAVQILWSV